MKKLCLILAICCCIQINAQTSITQSAMPSAGDTIRFSTVNPTGLTLNINQNGASQVWDYSFLVSNGQDLSQYVAANKTPYFFYFFNQLGLKTADSIGTAQFSFKNIYSFYTKNSTVFKAEGIGYSFQGIPLASNYTDDDEIYQFPLNYHDSDVSSFRFVFSVPGQNLFSFVQAGTRINYADGWGSITTPYKTYNSVLRIKTIVDEVDTLVTQFAKIPYPRKQVIYKWLSPDEKIPVLEITGAEVGGNFVATRITFRDAYNGKANPIAPRARFTVNKISGFANLDTFVFTDQTTPFATGFQWQITPSVGVKYVKGTSASSRNPSVVFTRKDLYSVTLISTNIAGSDDTTATDLINIDWAAGLERAGTEPFRIYPNPVSDELMVPENYILDAFELTDLSGRSVLSGWVTEKGRISLGNVKPGQYVLSCGNTRQMIVISRN